MVDINTIMEELKRKGYRSSVARRAMLKALSKSHVPLSVADLQKSLAKEKMRANKTTLYRELAMLIKEKAVTELRFDDNSKRYELVSEQHHHHLVCVRCENVEDVALERELDAEEKHIARAARFKVLNHSLEFYGLCQECQPAHASYA